MMQLIQEYTSAYAATYRGKAEKCLFTFSTGPEQLDFIFNWARNRYIQDMTHAVQQQSGQVLKLRLWRDTAPTWQTNYEGEIIASVPASVSSPPGMVQMASPFPWLVILGLGLAAIAVYFIIRPVIKSVTDLFWGPGGNGGNGGNGGLGDLGKLPWGLIVIAIIAIILIPQIGKRRQRD